MFTCIGQEDPTQEFDGEVQITPFNMKEEMEEGHFDKEGMYIFGKRSKDEVKDHWYGHKRLNLFQAFLEPNC